MAWFDVDSAEAYPMRDIVERISQFIGVRA